MNSAVVSPPWGMAGTGEEKSTGHSAAASAAAVDAVLLERVHERDEPAFNELVTRHYSLAFRLCARVLGNAADAEDVVQEAFVKLWNNPPQLRDGGALRAWIMRVGRNLAIDRLRQRRPGSDSELELLVDGSTAPDGQMRHGQAATRVSDAMARLPERQRTALQLTYFEGLGNQDTASMMDISVEAVESLLSRARRKLKVDLDHVWTELVVELEQLK